MSTLVLTRNLGRITLLELLWGLRIPENVIYNFLGPAIILVLLGKMRGEGYLAILVPGVIGIVTASSSMIGVGAPVAYMRVYGSWRTLQASPIPVGLYFAGLTLSRILRTVLIVAFMVVVARLVLDWSHQGPLALTLLWIMLGSAVFAALGLLVAYLVPSPQGVTGALNLILLPMIFIGNALFVVDTPWVARIAGTLPLTHLVSLVRGSVTGGDWTAGAGAWLAVLAAWAAVCSWAALVLARRRVEER